MSILGHRLLLITALLIGELLALAVAYQFFATIDCYQTDAQGTCRMLRSLVGRAVAVLAALVVFIWARPEGFARLLRQTATHAGAGPWVMLHGLGLAALCLPLVVAAGRDMSGMFQAMAGFWMFGAAAASIGALLWLAPPAAWRDWLATERYAQLPVLAVAILIPDLADTILPLWNWQALTTATFQAVVLFLGLFSTNTFADPAEYIIGVDDFYVHIAQACSGVEGIALVLGFTLLYAFLFRDRIRFPHYWLVVLPLGLVLSWLLNVVRIGALIMIGARVSPDIAVNGFHSYAGWMFFTLLALFLLYIVQALPWLHRGGEVRAGLPLRQDWAAARILPFVVFMLASVVAAALSTHADLAYPVKAAAMAAALAFFWPHIRSLDWRFDRVAVAAGVLIGLGWILLEQPVGGPGERALAAGLAGMSALGLALWVVVRIAGTVVLVPVIEELFFRGYVLARLDGSAPDQEFLPGRNQMVWRLLGIAVSSALFAALHGRWLAAGGAGVILALVMLRRGRVGDAVVAHVVANALVAAWALRLGDFSRI